MKKVSRVIFEIRYFIMGAIYGIITNLWIPFLVLNTFHGWIILLIAFLIIAYIEEFVFKLKRNRKVKKNEN